MPFTPFHMGPGLALKALAGRRFSVLSFGIAQVAMDIEPGVGMLRGSEVLHGWTHTYAGATVIGAVVATLAAPACLSILRRWNRELRHHRLDWLATPETLAPGSIAAGALIGTYSHVALDSVMHFDIRPLAPFSASNILYEAISIPALEIACVVAGLAGIAAWLLAARASRRRAAAAEEAASS